MNLSQIIDSMKKWCPGFLIALFVVLVFPIRILILLCLPPDSLHEWHPLHKIQDFWSFGE